MPARSIRITIYFVLFNARCERLWQGNADGLRGVARGFRELANEVKSRWITLSCPEKDEQAEYLAEARRLEDAADKLGSAK